METVLITGASRGVGLELTRQFLHLGYRVIATYRGEPSDGLSGLATTEALSLAELEVTESASIEKLASQLAGIKIDILINNAGVIGPDEQTFETLDADVWTKVFCGQNMTKQDSVAQRLLQLQGWWTVDRNDFVSSTRRWFSLSHWSGLCCQP